ncbi:alpha/beta fold hydrolase [Gardnerella sp. DNF00502]|uniref:alpha/beta fold hydrolase n=1 Tax=unclassified Gardnerella TaxID=2628112 RepID=UPI000C9F7907|nr:alpha/beta fold hydrolase [Gardnerella sp. KA00735]PNP89711.1 proline iminopeptidase [Gardnerella sp. KA00735]
MTLLTHYYVPGLYVEERAIDVPLDWEGNTPGDQVKGETIRLFCRVITSPQHAHDDLPLLVFLQGGPGGQCPRPLSPSSDGWIEEAVKHFRIVLPDQRGVGRSSRVDASTMKRMAADGVSVEHQAWYLKRFLADSIVRDFEHLRISEFDAKPWVSLGQSYGGFLTLTYLSLFPQGLIASFTTGGIPHVPANAREVYEHTFPRMATKTEQFYERYPQDVARVAAIADRISQGDVVLPNGENLTVERLQTLGSSFGMKPSFERIHWVLDSAFSDADGSLKAFKHSGGSISGSLSDEFLYSIMDETSSSPLYWPLQEFIYADGELDNPIRWAAQQVRDSMPEFSCSARPLLFTGEAVFPWMFDQELALSPFKPAVDSMMEDKKFGKIYDEEQLSNNEVPLQAAVYFDDLYVDSGLQLDTLSRISNSHYWTTNEFEHDGVHGSKVFRHLLDEARDRGDLQALYK